MIHKISFLLTVGATLLLAPLTTSHAQRSGSRLGTFSGGGGVSGVSGSQGYSGAAFRNNQRFVRGRGGYYGGRTRYYHHGSYYFYDPFIFGGFGYPYGSAYYGGFGPGYGLGYYGPAGYGYGDDGPYGERVYNGRIISEGGNARRAGGDREEQGEQYSPNSMARAVQSELKERGYYRGSVDGQFGSGTASALRKFQSDKGLKATGRLDERTLKALGFDER